MQPERQRSGSAAGAADAAARLRRTRDASAGRAAAASSHLAIDHVSLEMMLAEVVAHLRGQCAAAAAAAAVSQSCGAGAGVCARRTMRRPSSASKLADVDEPTAPFGLLDVHGDGTQIEEARTGSWTPQLARRLRAQARRLGVSAATSVPCGLGDWCVARTSGRDDVVFGTVLFGRLQGSAGARRDAGHVHQHAAAAAAAGRA